RPPPRSGTEAHARPRGDPRRLSFSARGIASLAGTCCIAGSSPLKRQIIAIVNAAEWVGAPANHNGQLVVLPDLTVPGHPQIFAIGDTVTIAAPDGKPVPGIAPAAKQAGRHVANTIKARLRGEMAFRAFRYKHAGSLAQIGKRRAVINFGFIKLRGALAW